MDCYPKTSQLPKDWDGKEQLALCSNCNKYRHAKDLRVKQCVADNGAGFTLKGCFKCMPEVPQ